VVCDPGSLLNLLATGHAADLIGPRRLLLGPLARAEPLFIYEDAARVRRLCINEALLRTEGVNAIGTDMAPEEIAEAIRLATRMGDAEAEAVAIASVRGIGIISDDVAVGIAAERAKQAHETTLRLLFDWGVRQPGEAVHAALASLSARASFVPPRTDRLRSWFMSNST
jgi:hypothetical protein